jgi:hypothetical protein
MARSASRKMTRKTSKRRASTSTKRRVPRKHIACVSKAAKRMFKKSTPKSAKGRGRVLARAQKACAKK